MMSVASCACVHAGLKKNLCLDRRKPDRRRSEIPYGAGNQKASSQYAVGSVLEAQPK